MSVRRTFTYLALGGLALLALFTVAPAAQDEPEKKPKDPGNEVIQEFPTNDAMRTAWKIHYGTTSGYGLYIQDAFFKKGPKEPWMQVLGDARLAEMFVPYHSGSPRFWDVSYNFSLTTVTKDDAGPHGKLLGGGEGKSPTVVMEVKDRGIMHMGYNGVKRGEKLVLFGTLLA